MSEGVTAPELSAENELAKDVPNTPPPSYQELEDGVASVNSSLPVTVESPGHSVDVQKGCCTVTFLCCAGCRSVFAGFAWMISFTSAIAQSSLLYYLLDSRPLHRRLPNHIDELQKFHKSDLEYHRLREQVELQFLTSLLLPVACLVTTLQIRFTSKPKVSSGGTKQFLMQCLILSLHLHSVLTSSRILADLSGIMQETRNYVTPTLSGVATLVQSVALHSGYESKTTTANYGKGLSALFWKASLAVYSLSLIVALSDAETCDQSIIRSTFGLSAAIALGMTIARTIKKCTWRLEKVETIASATIFMTMVLTTLFRLLQTDPLCDSSAQRLAVIIFLVPAPWALHHLLYLMPAITYN